MATLQAYIDAGGRSRFEDWFSSLDIAAAVKVTTALERVALGNLSSIKTVGGGVTECRIEFGPGYRVYFGRDGDRWVILLGGGTKKRQSRDVAEAQAAWSDYKRRKRQTEKVGM